MKRIAIAALLAALAAPAFGQWKGQPLALDPSEI